MIDFKQKYIKYKNKYFNELKKIKGGMEPSTTRHTSPELQSLIEDIKIEESGGNIFAIAAARTFDYLNTK